MSEEKKKNGAQNEGRHTSKPSHRRGYFIQPPTEGSQANKVELKNEGARPAPSAQERQAKPHRHKHHRPYNKTGTQAGAGADIGNAAKNEARNQAKAAEAAKPPQSKPEQSAASPAQNGGNKKKNRSRNRHKAKHPSSESQMPATKDLEPIAQAPLKERQPLRPFMHDARPSSVHATDEYEEYKLLPDEDGQAEDTAQQADEQAPRTEVIGVRFKTSGKTYYFDPKGSEYKKGTHAIVDTARGPEFGEVALSNTFVKSADIVPPLREVIRAATNADIEHHADNKRREEEAFVICAEKIAAHKLDMKLIEAQYTFDNSKLLFYFTSADRVDFRELVKDLAGVFRTRIELRQIGIRDEAKLMGGLGVCGRPLCCTLFLSDFDQVSIKMAKEQNLSLNSSKISGICGRLMCCLKYEHEAYEYEIKRTPPVDSLVRTENGDGIVTEINPLRGLIRVKLLGAPEQQPKYYHRDNVTMLRKKKSADKGADNG